MTSFIDYHNKKCRFKKGYRNERCPHAAEIAEELYCCMATGENRINLKESYSEKFSMKNCPMGHKPDTEPQKK